MSGNITSSEGALLTWARRELTVSVTWHIPCVSHCRCIGDPDDPDYGALLIMAWGW